MQMQEKVNREVKIWALLREALRHWRILLILALVFAAAGALFYERSYKQAYAAAEAERRLQIAAEEDAAEIAGEVSISEEEVEIDEEAEKKAEEELEASISSLTLEQVENLIAQITVKGRVTVRELLNSVDALDEAMDGMRVYLKDSVRMQIDPYATCQAISELYVDPPEGAEAFSLEKRNHILSRYRAALVSQVDYTEAAQALGCEPKYVRELVSVSVDFDGGVVRFLVVHHDAKAAQKIVSYISEQLRAMEPAITADYGLHRLSIIEGDVQTIYDPDQVSFSANAWKNFFAIETSVSSYKKRVTTALKTIAEGGESELVDIDSIQQTLTPLPTHSMAKLVVYAAAGYILGFAVLVFLIMLWILIRGRIVDENDLAGVGVRTLTELNAKRKGRQLRGVDVLVDRIGRTADFTGSDEQRLRKAAAFIGEYGEGAERLLLTGDVPQGGLEGLARQLSEFGGLPELICQAGLCTNPGAVENLKDCDGVILVESPLKSSYRLALQDLRVAADLEKPVIGAIYL